MVYLFGAGLSMLFWYREYYIKVVLLLLLLYHTVTEEWPDGVTWISSLNSKQWVTLFFD